MSGPLHELVGNALTQIHSMLTALATASCDEADVRRIVREEVAAIESERFARVFTNIDEMVADYAATSLVLGDQTALQARQEPPEAGGRHDR